MPIISKIENDRSPQLNDKVVGTSISGPPEDNTANFLLEDILGLFKTGISLQDVVNVGNTIVVPTTKAKGIDITLANLETVYQNGVSVTVPSQTGSNASPDAYIANINGQVPSVLPGFIGGFVVNAHGLDNTAFYADLQSDSGTSAGCVMKSFDSHSGDLFRGQKEIGGINSTVFKVAHNGDVKSNTLSIYDYPNGEYCKIAINDSSFTISRPQGAFTPMLSTENGDNLILINSSGAAAQIINNLLVSRNYTLPNASGTFALTSDITVPNLQEVTDAGHVTNNDISVHSLFLYDEANDGDGNISFNDNVFRVRGLGNPNYFFTVDNGQILSLHNGTAYARITNNLTTEREYFLPDASGTFALTSDLTNLVTINSEQTITGAKTFNGGIIFDAEQATIAMLNRYDTGSSIGITLYNTATDPEGLRINNDNDSGTGIALTNSLSGSGFNGYNASTGVLMTLAASVSSTGDLLRCLKNNVITTKINNLGEITATKLIKSGGAPSQYLMADGSALSNIYTNNTTTALSLTTLNSTYPTAIIGYRVHCTSITAGKLIYEKTSTGWVSYPITVVV